MNLIVYRCLIILYVAVSLFCFSESSIAGGITTYTGNYNSSGAAVSSMNNNASADINLEFKTHKFIALGIYNETGQINNPIFANPSADFPLGTTFTAAESKNQLVTNETSLDSKFSIDGLTNLNDAAKIINAMTATANTKTDDILIKGAIFTNSTNTLNLSTSIQILTLTGGTGPAPIIVLRGLAGIPGGTTTQRVGSVNPMTIPLAITNTKKNPKGYSRFVIVGDFRERSITRTTSGNWTGSFTITLTGL